MGKVAFAQGGFDPLHVGHIEYLERARSIADKLIVSVARDKHLIAKKGFVFMPEEERLKIVKSLRCVDEAMFHIDEDGSCVELTRELFRIYGKDLILVKGGDRFAHEIPERFVCAELGIPIVDGLGEKIQSSSWLTKGMRAG